MRVRRFLDAEVSAPAPRLAACVAATAAEDLEVTGRPVRAARRDPRHGERSARDPGEATSAGDREYRPSRLDR